MYLEKTKTLIQKDSWATILMLVLLTIANIWKQPKWPSTSEWIKKIWYFIYIYIYIYSVCVCVCVCTHNRILAIKKNEMLLFVAKGMDPTDYHTKWGKSETDKYYVASFICEVQTNNINELICKTETDFQTKETNLWLPKGKLGVKN